jgi:hypothetical protein
MNANEVSDIIYKNIWGSIQYSVPDVIHVHVTDKIWADAYFVLHSVARDIRNNVENIVRFNVSSQIKKHTE